MRPREKQREIVVVFETWAKSRNVFKKTRTKKGERSGRRERKERGYQIIS
jgi:hypothetical protein